MGRLYWGAGYFSTVNGVYRPRIARLHAEGSLDSVFYPNVEIESVSLIALQPDGKILLSADFSPTDDMESRRGIARLENRLTVVPSTIGQNDLCFPIKARNANIAMICF
jgi:hypothetical protein